MNGLGRAWLPAALMALACSARAQDAAPAGNDAPPAVEGAAPAGNDSSSAVEGAAPAAGTTVDATPAAPPIGGDSEQFRELPTIYVTAQKRKETLQEVPASVSTIDGNLIRDSGSNELPEMANYAANVQLSLTPATSDFYIRGFGTASTNAGFEPSVAAVVDGVYYGRSNFLASFFHDLERIEVLRGPQGTLFGKNSSAGVLNIVTVAPGDNFFTNAEVLIDTSGQRAIKPVLNIPLGDGLAMRLSGILSEDFGGLKNTDLDRHEGNVRQQTGRLRIRWAPDADWSLNLGGFLSHQVLDNNLFQLSELGENMMALMRSFDDQVETSTDNFKSSSNVPAKAIVTFGGASATYDHAADGLLGIDELAFTSVSAYAQTIQKRRDFDADFSPVPVIKDTLAEPSPYKQISQELRFTGRHANLLGYGNEFKFVIGGFYFHSTLKASDIFALEDLGATLSYLVAANADQNGNGRLAGGLFGGPLGGDGSLTTLIDAIAPLLGPAIGQDQSALVKLSQRTDANAAFGQSEWNVWRDFWIIGGLRVGEERKHGHATSFTDSRIIPFIANQNNHDTKLKRSEDEVSPKAGLKWQPNANLDTYVTWSQGFKSGGFNALPLNDQNLEFDPEKATSLEAGAKARLLGGSLTVSAAAFATRFADLQVSTFRGGNFIILNAARARSRGVEADLNWLPPIPGTALFTSFGYTDAIYTRYPDAPAPADSSANPPTQDLAGRRLAITPRYSTTVIPSYTLMAPSLGGGMTFAVDYIYRGDRYLDVDLDPRTYQPATNEVNARVTFADDHGNWRITLGAKNLTNETILAQVLDEPLAPGDFGAIRSDRGRYYQAVVTAAFPAP